MNDTERLEALKMRLLTANGRERISIEGDIRVLEKRIKCDAGITLGRYLHGKRLRYDGGWVTPSDTYRKHKGHK